MNDTLNQNGSYWTSVLLVGSLFGLIACVSNLVTAYIQIGSEPTGSLFNPTMFLGVAICLVTSLAGLAAVWHYTREVSSSLTLGRGALIGFLTGLAIVIISFTLGQLWLFIDPEFIEKVVNSTVENIEAMDLPSDAAQQTIDASVASVRSGYRLMGVLIQLPIMGLLNLLTALIGVKIFADKKEAL